MTKICRKAYGDWKCECGEAFNIRVPGNRLAWRWNGAEWQHFHNFEIENWVSARKDLSGWLKSYRRFCSRYSIHYRMKGKNA